jgi:hypothetical protein
MQAPFQVSGQCARVIRRMSTEHRAIRSSRTRGAACLKAGRRALSLRDLCEMITDTPPETEQRDLVGFEAADGARDYCQRMSKRREDSESRGRRAAVVYIESVRCVSNLIRACYDRELES